MNEHRKKFEKNNLKIKKIKVLIIIFILILCLILAISVLARYVSNSLNDFFLESKEFYFYSDKLKSVGATYQIDNWSGVDDYNIIINMNSMKNNLKKSSYDIGYEISYTATENVICQLSKNEGIISSSTNLDSFNLIITPNAKFENGDSATINIVAKSKGNYEKELKASFKLIVGQEKVTYQIEDDENKQYLELNITNTQSYYLVREEFANYSVGDRLNITDYLNLSEENKAKCYSAEITLSFNPSEVILDTTDKNYLNAKNVEYINFNGYNYINKIVLEVDAVSSENIRFYKVDKTKDYTYPIINEDSIVKVEIK